MLIFVAIEDGKEEIAANPSKYTTNSADASIH
jgi:hypothetical protein